MSEQLQLSGQTMEGDLRGDLARIAQWVRPNSRVLDLGCGDGALLAHLKQSKSVQGVGVEISDDRVLSCVKRGVHVVQQNLEDGLAMFDDQQFDTVVLSQTLQSMHNTEHILREDGARCDERASCRSPILAIGHMAGSILRGRMPVTGQMPYDWYRHP